MYQPNKQVLKRKKTNNSPIKLIIKIKNKETKQEKTGNEMHMCSTQLKVTISTCMSECTHDPGRPCFPK